MCMWRRWVEVNTIKDAFSERDFPLVNFWICIAPAKAKVAFQYVSSWGCAGVWRAQPHLVQIGLRRLFLFLLQNGGLNCMACLGGGTEKLNLLSSRGAQHFVAGQHYCSHPCRNLKCLLGPLINLPLLLRKGRSRLFPCFGNTIVKASTPCEAALGLSGVAMGWTESWAGQLWAAASPLPSPAAGHSLSPPGNSLPTCILQD